VTDSPIRTPRFGSYDRTGIALSKQLPAPNGDLESPQRTWRLIDELAFPLPRKLPGGREAKGAAVGTVSDEATPEVSTPPGKACSTYVARPQSMRPRR
jgi:hypothetical protein